MSLSDEVYSLNFGFLGRLNVGKTSILNRFVEDTFESFLPTIGVFYRSKYIKIKEKKIKLQIWDKPEDIHFYNKIRKIYYENMDGIIAIYDVTSLDSFEDLKYLIKDFEKDKLRRKAFKVLVGNKCDCLDRVVTEEEGRKLANDYKMNFFETSAKTDQNIIEIFYFMVNEILKNRKDKKNNIIIKKFENPKRKKMLLFIILIFISFFLRYIFHKL